MIKKKKHQKTVFFFLMIHEAIKEIFSLAKGNNYRIQQNISPTQEITVGLFINIKVCNMPWRS